MRLSCGVRSQLAAASGWGVRILVAALVSSAAGDRTSSLLLHQHRQHDQTGKSEQTANGLFTSVARLEGAITAPVPAR